VIPAVTARQHYQPDALPLPMKTPLNQPPGERRAGRRRPQPSGRLEGTTASVGARIHALIAVLGAGDNMSGPLQQIPKGIAIRPESDHFETRKPGTGSKHLGIIPSEMSGAYVPRSKSLLECWGAHQEQAASREVAGPAAERRYIVFYVLQHFERANQVEQRGILEAAIVATNDRTAVGPNRRQGPAG
jgi:hypothetical protein